MIAPTASAPLVAVIGATGTVGAPLVAALSPHLTVRSLLRRPPERPISGRHALVDFSSVESLTRAMCGADALFLGIGTTPELPRLEAVALAAAQAAGVRRVVRISAPEVSGVAVSEWHMQCEAQLAETGLLHVNLRPSAFMQNWLRNAAPIRHAHRFASSAGQGARNYVDARDVAEVAARLIRGLVPWPEPVLEVRGPEAISQPDMATRLTAALGRPIRCDHLDADAHQALLQRHGVPAWLAAHVVELDALAREHPETGSTMLDAWLDAPPRTMDEFLAEHRASFAPSLLGSLSRLVAKWPERTPHAEVGAPEGGRGPARVALSALAGTSRMR